MPHKKPKRGPKLAKKFAKLPEARRRLKARALLKNIKTSFFDLQSVADPRSNLLFVGKLVLDGKCINIDLASNRLPAPISLEEPKPGTAFFCDDKTEEEKVDQQPSPSPPTKERLETLKQQTTEFLKAFEAGDMPISTTAEKRYLATQTVKRKKKGPRQQPADTWLEDLGKAFKNVV